MKQTLKRITPAPVLNVVKNAYDAIRRLPKVPDAYLHPWRRESRNRMYAMKDIHRGERCFIIGNGPSLRNTDLSKLKDECTFGMNRIYLLFPELGFTTTYFASINDLVIEQCAEDIAALPIPKLIAWHSNRHFQRFPDDMVFLYTTYTGPQFAYDMTRRIWEGATVTNIVLQLAFYMGFEQVILIGVDHNFANKLVDPVKLEIALPDGLIVGHHHARAGLPIQLFGHFHHSVLVLIAGHFLGDGHKPRIKRGPRPVVLGLGRHSLKLPVGHELHGSGEVAPVEFGGKIMRKRPRVGRCIAGRRDMTVLCIRKLRREGRKRGNHHGRGKKRNAHTAADARRDAHFSHMFLRYCEGMLFCMSAGAEIPRLRP